MSRPTDQHKPLKLTTPGAASAEMGKRVPGVTAISRRLESCDQCADSESLRTIAEALESRGLACRMVTYKGTGPEERDIAEIVITNPAAKQRGEMRVGDDGSVSWECFGNLDEAGKLKILDDVTNCLRATGARSSLRRQS